MVDLSQILQLLKIEPGSGLLQSALLFMIYWSSHGVRKDIKALLLRMVTNENRMNVLEGRVTNLETKEKV